MNSKRALKNNLFKNKDVSEIITYIGMHANLICVETKDLRYTEYNNLSSQSEARYKMLPFVQKLTQSEKLRANKTVVLTYLCKEIL